MSWRIQEGSSGGTISATGATSALYQAPGVVGTYHVIATSNGNGTLSATIAVTVGNVTTGVWQNVTPASVNMTASLSCGNYGTSTIGVDPRRPSDLYTTFGCQGIWKSTDFGLTWNGPINTGTNGDLVNGACTISVADGGAGKPPILYGSCIRGPYIGFLASTNGGIDWTSYRIGPLPSNRQDVYEPCVDPYNPQHLLMAGHEQNYVVESLNGGQTWTNVSLDSGMREIGGTGYVFFVDTGSAATTASTWLWMAQASGGDYGTWRTANGGTRWTKVDRNEHPHGASQIYQPGNGVVYMAGVYSSLGWGVLRSSDYGQTWTHVGATSNETVVWGSPTHVYTGYGWANGIGTTDPTNFQMATQPGTGTWTNVPTPAAMVEGPGRVAVTFNGSQYIFVGAMWHAGLWRYVEP